jgi:hypothetical protein
MDDIVDGFVPLIPMILVFDNTFVQPWVMGYQHSPFATYYQYIDINPGKQHLASGR